MKIISALEDKNNFNTSEKIISTYILKNKEKVLDMSIQELGMNTYSSSSTIVRLCRKIGTKGYKDFKIKLSAEIQKSYDNISDVDANFPFTDDDSYMDISEKIFKLSNDSLSQAHDLLSNDVLEEAVNMILGAKRVAIFAEGDSFIRTLSFQNKLMKINHTVLLSSLPGENEQLAYTLDKNDCGIIVSYSGNNKGTVKIVDILKRNRVKIMSITAKPDAYVGKRSTLIIPLAKKESQTIRFSTFSSQIQIEYVLNVIYSCLFIANYDKNQKTRIAAEIVFSRSKLDPNLD